MEYNDKKRTSNTKILMNNIFTFYFIKVTKNYERLR